MGVDAVLQSTAPVDKGGVLTRTRRGQLCYDMAALTRDLKQRSAALILEHAPCTVVLATLSKPSVMARLGLTKTIQSGFRKP